MIFRGLLYFCRDPKNHLNNLLHRTIFSYCRRIFSLVVINYSTNRIFAISDESDTATGEKNNFKNKNGELAEVRLKVPDRTNLSESGSDTEVMYSSTSEPYRISSDERTSSLPPKKWDNKQKRNKKECIVM